MRNRNYTKEIGLNIEERPVPTFVSAALLVAVAVLVVLFARQVNSLHHTAAEAKHSPAEIKVSSR
jgi:hypothetical protein